jgi:hypothetical protein
MTKDQKIIRAKAGLLELAKQLGNVSQACKIMGNRAPQRRPRGSRQYLTDLLLPLQDRADTADLAPE